MAVLSKLSTERIESVLTHLSEANDRINDITWDDQDSDVGDACHNTYQAIIQAQTVAQQVFRDIQGHRCGASAEGLREILDGLEEIRDVLTTCLKAGEYGERLTPTSQKRIKKVLERLGE